MAQIQPNGVNTPSFTQPGVVSQAVGPLTPSLTPPAGNGMDVFNPSNSVFPGINPNTNSGMDVFAPSSSVFAGFVNPPAGNSMNVFTPGDSVFPGINPGTNSGMDVFAPSNSVFPGINPSANNGVNVFFPGDSIFPGVSTIGSDPVDEEHRRRRASGPRFEGPGAGAQGRTTVALLEVGPDEPFAEGGKDGHDEAVQQVVKSFASGAKTVTYSFYPPTESTESTGATRKLSRTAGEDGESEPALTVDDINTFIDQSAYSALNLASKNVTEIVQKDPTTGVINMSLGISKKSLSQTLMASAIDSDPATGRALSAQLGINPNDLNAYYNDPNFANPVKRINIQSEAKQNIENAISTYVNRRFDMPGGDGAQNFQGGLAEWRKATGQLASQGVVVVVSAGNDRSSSATPTQLNNGDELNILAMSGNVISVAASSTNTRNATPAEFSSRGGDGFNPTLSADGTEIAVRLDGKRTLVDGTSFSAPTVSATVARLKEINPNLSFTDIKQILTGTAFNTSASAAEEGAGILNFRGALNQAAGANSIFA